MAPRYRLAETPVEPGGVRLRTLVAFTILALSFITAVLPADGQGNDVAEKAAGSNLIGKELVDFELADLTGEVLRYSDIDSAWKLIVLFSVHDCQVCLQEYRLWKKIDQSFTREQVTVVGISHDQDRKSVDQFAGLRGLNFPILLNPDDSVRKSLGLTDSPLRVLIGGSGKIVAVDKSDANIESQRTVLQNLRERTAGS
ncbi:MAG: TlpA family protein disulfide reductase [bacterium]|nr:TlpA family protein disulfide reductase [bacterium]